MDNTTKNKMANSNDLPPTLQEYLPIIWRGKWILFFTILLAVNGAFFYTNREEPEYQAKVSVFISTRGDRVRILDGISVDNTKSIGNELEFMKSRMMAELVAERLMEIKYLDEDSRESIPILSHYNQETDTYEWSSKNSVTSRVRSAVSFEAMRETDFVTITAKSKYNREAALLANMYAEVYYERNFQLSRKQSTSVREFLENQLSIKRSDLERAEQQFKNYMERHGVVRMDDESRRVIDQISQLEAQREATEVEIQSLSSMYASLQRQLEEQEPNVARNISSADNPYIRMIQEQIAQLEVERDLTLSQNPSARTDERYVRMLADIDEQLQDLRENLRRRTDEYMQAIAPGRGNDPAGYIRELRLQLLETDIQMQGLRYRKAAVDKSLERYEQLFNRLPQVSMEYARLQRARTSSEQLYLMLEQRYNEVVITEQSEFGRVEIVDRAQVPSRPMRKNFLKMLIMGLFLGSGLGFVLVIGRERFFGPIRVPEELQKNGFVSLSTVSSMKIKSSTKNGVYIKNGKELDPMLIMLNHPLSPAAESFRLMRTLIKRAQDENNLHTITITSANPGDGKTTVAVNTAISYAQAGEKVLLIDCDLRKPTLAGMLAQSRKPGLVEVLAGEMSFDEVVQQTVVDNLHFLAGGTMPANPSELLGSENMNSLLTILDDRYHIILLDSPPILAASDPLVLATITDGLILVAKAGSTKMKELELTRESIVSVGATVLGVVLNFFDYRHAYGSKYAYKYYRYGNYGYSRDGKGGSALKEVKIERRGVKIDKGMGNRENGGMGELGSERKDKGNTSSEPDNNNSSTID
jgi:capsular exopolysaccharide synthesis family protein